METNELLKALNRLSKAFAMFAAALPSNNQRRNSGLSPRRRIRK